MCLRLLDGDQAVQEFEAPGTYGSKKAAKEKAAEMGLNWLEAQAGPEKQKKGQAQGLLPAVAEKPDMSENWVGVLHGRSGPFLLCDSSLYFCCLSGMSLGDVACFCIP